MRSDGVSHIYLKGILALLIICIASCASPSADLESGAESSGPSAESIVIIIFDPTILRADQGGELSSWLGKLGEFYSRVPEGSRVATFTISRGMAQKSPIDEVEFIVDTGYEGKEHGEQQVKKHFETLRPKLELEWKSAHSGQESKKPTSCIASSLWAASKYIQRYLGSAESRRFHIVIVSDMMESCDEWGHLVRAEKGINELDHLRPLNNTIDLKKVSSVVAVQVPNEWLVTPLENESLAGFWRSFLENCGIKNGSIFYSSGFPIDFDFSQRGGGKH